MSADLDKIAQELTQRLNTDENFRSLFVRDPKAAMAQLGFELDEEKARAIRENLAERLSEAGEDVTVKPCIIPI